MTTPLSDAEARRVTHCDECGYDWQQHTSSKGAAWDCPRNSWEQVLVQVAALVAERETAVLEQAARTCDEAPLPPYDTDKYAHGYIDGQIAAARIVRDLIAERAR